MNSISSFNALPRIQSSNFAPQASQLTRARTEFTNTRSRFNVSSQQPSFSGRFEQYMTNYLFAGTGLYTIGVQHSNTSLKQIGFYAVMLGLTFLSARLR